MIENRGTLPPTARKVFSVLARFLEDHGFDAYGKLDIKWMKAVSGQKMEASKR